MSDKMMVRAYPVAPAANPGKIDQLVALLPLWQDGCQLLLRRTIIDLQHGGKVSGFIDTKDLPDWLSQRQWKSVWNQVSAAIKAWLGTLETTVRRLLNGSSLDEDTAKHVRQINAANAWWRTGGTHAPEHYALARTLVKHAITLRPAPRLSRVRTMLMDSPICRIEAPRTGSFDGWAQIATTQRGKPVWVPFTSTDRTTNAPGQWCGQTQVIITSDGDLRLMRPKKEPAAEPRTDGDVLALDWGLHTLFATSDGRLLGRRLYQWLQTRDDQLQTLTKALQKQGRKFTDCRRYTDLVTRIRAHVTNEVGRILNQLAAEDLRELVVEDLDFRGKTMSRRMRRIVTMAGRGAVKHKLDSLRLRDGITVTKVNPAYTSQTCRSCGYIHRSNRTGEIFRCRFCGMRTQADIHGARNTLDRRSVDTMRGKTRMSVRQIRSLADSTFQQRWGLPMSAVKHHPARTAGPRASATPRGATQGSSTNLRSKRSSTK